MKTALPLALLSALLLLTRPAGSQAERQIARPPVPTQSAGSVRLQLLGSGQFTLIYQFTGEPQALISGTFGVDDEEVRLEAGQEYEDNLEELLLPEDIRLTRTLPGTTLTAAIPTTANLQAFDPVRFAGLNAVPGTVRVRFERR